MSWNPTNRNQQNEDHQSISEVLQDFVEKHHLEKGLNKVNVSDAWFSEMGPAIGKYTTGIKLQGDTLYVQLSNAILREKLSYGREKIINLLNRALKRELIKKLVLR